MSKKSILEREQNRQKIVAKYASKRKALIELFKKTLSLEDKFRISHKIQKLPKNSSKVRLRNRCWKTGKARGYYRFFGLSRNSLREMGSQCLIPGLTKSSW